MNKNHYPISGYHPDSNLKLDFYISKSIKKDKKQNQGLLTLKIQGGDRGFLRDQHGINGGSTGDQQGIHASVRSSVRLVV